MKTQNGEQILQNHHKARNDTRSGETFGSQVVEGHRKTNVSKISVKRILYKGPALSAGNTQNDSKTPRNQKHDQDRH